MGGRYLLSVDGTGHFSSSKVHCANCCEKRHKDGTTTYYHQSLCAVLVHPQRREVLPVVAPEAIVKSDGRKKNDCERNAAKRLLTELRREHPHLGLVVVEDGLASNGPHIRLLKVPARRNSKPLAEIAAAGWTPAPRETICGIMTGTGHPSSQ